MNIMLHFIMNCNDAMIILMRDEGILTTKSDAIRPEDACKGCKNALLNAMAIGTRQFLCLNPFWDCWQVKASERVGMSRWETRGQ